MNYAQEIERLYEAFTTFTGKMLSHIQEKAHEGWTGWDDEEMRYELKQRLLKNLAEGDYVDDANLCLFLDHQDAGPTLEEADEATTQAVNAIKRAQKTVSRAQRQIDDMTSTKMALVDIYTSLYPDEPIHEVEQCSTEDLKLLIKDGISRLRVQEIEEACALSEIVQKAQRHLSIRDK